VLFLVSNKPYQAPIYNNYVLANEAFYTAIIIAMFIFSDATPDLDIKTYAAIVLLSSCGLLIFVNLLMVLVVACKGKDKLKDETNQAKLKRAEKELLEQEEEEERRLHQQRLEEEFIGLPADQDALEQYEDEVKAA
jgi:hypothetical protein